MTVSSPINHHWNFIKVSSNEPHTLLSVASGS